MKWFRYLAAPVVCLLSFALTTPTATAQVSINVQIGPAPVCPYGYFDYAPYSCTPFGYYGPQWFTGGLFLGAGPWFHGPVGFRGYVDHAYDPRFGYRGPFPKHGEHADWGKHYGWEKHFHGNEERPQYRHDNGNHNGQYKDHDNNGHGHGHDHDDDHGNGKDHGHRHDD
jgi:hypothetical protein